MIIAFVSSCSKSFLNRLPSDQEVEEDFYKTPSDAWAALVSAYSVLDVSGYGNMIVIEHNSKYRTRYAHLDKILVRIGTKVAQNDRIGKVGDTGFIRKKGRDGSHLHFEVLAFGKQMNPLYVL